MSERSRGNNDRHTQNSSRTDEVYANRSRERSYRFEQNAHAHAGSRAHARSSSRSQSNSHLSSHSYDERSAAHSTHARSTHAYSNRTHATNDTRSTHERSSARAGNVTSAAGTTHGTRTHSAHATNAAHTTRNTHSPRSARALTTAPPHPEQSAHNTRVHQTAQRKKGRFAKRLAIAFVLVAALVGGGIAWYVNSISSNLHEGVTQEVRDVLVETEYSKEPFYMLLMGTDESQERAADEYYGSTFRSDSMMLARIDCPNKKVALVSLERDTMLDMGEYGWQKLNAASAFGGPAFAIEMVSKMAHNTPISHYALIDFDGFCEVVDALGGIEVTVPIEINDDDAGGYLPAGTQTLNGEQALILCRSRNAYEEYGSGNTYRSANQRMVLSAIAQKVLASDIATIASTVATLSKYLSTDLEISDIIGIAQAMRGLDMSSDMYTAMQPTTAVYENDLWYIISNEPEWQDMLTRVNEGLPPTESDEVDASGTVMATAGTGQSFNTAGELGQNSGTVAIRNGGAPAGSGGVVGEQVEALGYTADIANANASTYTETLVVYQTSDQRAQAMELAQTIGVGRVVQNENGEYLMNGDFLVILGSDFA